MSDKCINCLAELTDQDCRLKYTFDFEKGVFTRNEPQQKKRGRPPRARQIQISTQRMTVEVGQVLDLIFQMLDQTASVERGPSSPSPDDGLCVQCAETLTHLFNYYIQFISASRLSSRIHGALQRLESLQRYLGRQFPHVATENNDCTLPKITKSWSQSESRESRSISACVPEAKSLPHIETDHFEAMDNPYGSDALSLPNFMNPQLVLERLDVDIKMESLDYDIPGGDAEVDVGFQNFTNVKEAAGHSEPKRKYDKRIYVSKSKESTRAAAAAIPSLKPKPTHNWRWKSTKKFSPCKKCCEMFNYKSHLKIHMNTHAEISKHECPVCVCSFKTHHQLRTHMFKEHPNSSVPWVTNMPTPPTFSDFNCDRCRRKFVTAGGLKRHLVEQHLHCSLCKTDYTTLELVTVHMEGTHGPNWIRSVQVCELCGYKTENRHLMRRHRIRVHSEANLSQHTCHICGKGLEGPGELAKHLLVHTDERPFQCDRCPMTYKFSSNLRAHKMVHDGIKFVCHLCGHASTSPANLRKHIAGVHHGVSQAQKRTPDGVKKKRVRPKDVINNAITVNLPYSDNRDSGFSTNTGDGGSQQRQTTLTTTKKDT